MRGIAFGGESDDTPLDVAIAVMHRASAIRLIAGGGALLALAGLVVVGASRSGAPAGAPPATLSQSQAAAAGSALGENPVLRELSRGAHFIVVSTGEFRIAGELVGTASIIRFDDPTTLAGSWPTFHVRNAVSEQELADGAQVPDHLDIDYTVEQRSATASAYSVLVDFDGQIKDITVVPEPPTPAVDPVAGASTPQTIASGG